MSVKRFSGAEELSGSVIVEMDAQGRIWLGLPVQVREKQATGQECSDIRESSEIEPGHLGRDGEWW